jgi:ribonucleoside-diphosphate reductase alpha chain
MYVIKRNGEQQKVSFDKILHRINYLKSQPFELKNVNAEELTMEVIKTITNGITTVEIDEHTADLSASQGITHIEYLSLAGRIEINNHHKNTLTGFKDKMYTLMQRKNTKGKPSPLISKHFYTYVMKNQSAIDKYIDYERDYQIDYFGFKTLKKGYLMRIGAKIIERPQDMIMRAAIQMYIPTEQSRFQEPQILEKIFRKYDDMSLHRYYTPATPTLFNSGGLRPQLSSCYILPTVPDSLEGIMGTLQDCAQHSKYAGGVGFPFSSLRCCGSLIEGTNGKSSGIVPMLRMYNDCSRAFNQGGKRNGSFAVYLEPHHPDLLLFLDLKKTHGDENLRCRDLFPALWIPDLFLKRLEANANWSMFDPNECPGLEEVYGEEYEKLYTMYEQSGKAYATIAISKIVHAITESQILSGTPYLMFKDTINKHNMQANLGIVKSSNLCTEITLHTNPEETAVCNLSSICLSQFVEDTHTPDDMRNGETRPLNHEFPKNPRFNYRKLVEIAGEVAENIDSVIDRTYSSTIRAARSNFRNRPIGIGIQGLADVFMKFRCPFESEEARILNKNIAEAIYYGALWKSTLIAKDVYKQTVKKVKAGQTTINLYPKRVLELYPALKKENTLYTFQSAEEVPMDIGAYPTYHKGEAPIKTKFHWELYGLKPCDLSGMFDWESLRDHINIYGVRNSTITAYMPTASTSQIMGNVPSFEPYTTNMYIRSTLAKEFVVINKYLVNDLMNAGLWDDAMINYIRKADGSIQNLEGIPKIMKQLYKTVWDIKQKTLMQLAADRQPFVDQSQSMNLFIRDYKVDTCAGVLLNAWKMGLKTACYYLRAGISVNAQKFTVTDGPAPVIAEGAFGAYEKKSVQHDEEDICLGCGS